MLILPNRGVHPPHDTYGIPTYFYKIYKFSPYSCKIYKFPPIFFQLTFFGLGLIYVFFFLPILTMMHLCIMLYTYWTPLLPNYCSKQQLSRQCSETIRLSFSLCQEK